MLPANLGLATANQMQAKRELPISLSPIKPGSSSSSSSTLTVTTSSSNGPSQVGKEEMRYLPIAAMPTKPCSITIGTLNNNNNKNNNNNNINNVNSNNSSSSCSIYNNTATLKTKLTPMNIVQKQLKPKSSTTTVAPPLIQLVTATNPNPNANQSLLSLLTPKALVAPNNALPQPQSQSQAVLIRPTTTMTTIPVHPAPQQHQQQQQQQNGSSSSKGGATAAQTNLLAVVSSKTGDGNKTSKLTVKYIIYIYSTYTKRELYKLPKFSYNLWYTQVLYMGSV